MSTINDEAKLFCEVITMANVACYELANKYRNSGLPFQLANSILSEVNTLSSNAHVLQTMCTEVRILVAKGILAENGIEFTDK